MYALAGINLALNNSVVLDAPFTRHYMGDSDWLKFIKAFAKKYKATIKVIWCEAPNDVRKTRLISRGHNRDKERLLKLHEFVSKAKRFDIPFKHIYVTTKKLDWGKILNFLE